ncbi:acyl-CoA/acyl-ACP dehydrogenase [Granulosicoccus sp.]|nr:acyl-CoA dehydrogenase family protein [Granulosicoccus sp.]MDB4223062.1 acyl-CoA/acyl-ACP dehydrogenase [Granulosicoccus sp.]
MNFDLTDERKMLQETLRRFLQAHYSNALISELGETSQGYSDEIWAGLADLGIIGALFSDAHGGYGCDGFDIALVFEELGRVGAVDPLLDTAILGGGLLVGLGDDKYSSNIEAIIAGKVQMALAHNEPGSRYELSRVQTTANRQADQYVLNGQKAVVINAEMADYLIVSARTSGAVADCDGISLFLLPGDMQGLELRSYPVSSGGRAAEILLDNVSVPATSLLGVEGCAFDELESVQARATLAICAEAIGLMNSISQLTIDYLKIRNQFGQPLGKFQVLQHRMADMLIEIEQAKSALINLAGHLENTDIAVREKHVSAAKNLIGIVAKLVAEESIQMHGGIGVTMEYELAHLVRRLVMVDHRFGDCNYHLERFIDLAVA